MSYKIITGKLNLWAEECKSETFEEYRQRMLERQFAIATTPNSSIVKKRTKNKTKRKSGLH